MPADPTPSSPFSRRRAIAAIGLAGAGVAGITTLAGCKDPGQVLNQAEPSEPPPKASAMVTSPPDGATDVPVSTEIVFSTTDAENSSFQLTDASGEVIDGAMHPDGQGWLPAKSLSYESTYTGTVTATGDDGKTVTVTNSFATMAKPSKIVSVISWLPDDRVIGTGMPLIFQLSRAIPKSQRAALQRRLLVTVEPYQEGIWTWYTDKELHWRPREFWQANTQIFVNARAGGLPVGDGYFCKRDLTLTCSSGRHLVMTVDNKVSPKVLKVVKDGELIREIPVSLGKATWESSSGVAVIIEKKEETVFDTTDEPDAREQYRVDIEFAQRLTWGGEFIHAAPWSVQHQGVRNVSHGCINMSTENAKWLFELTLVGDPVITINTGRKLEYGNGWTDWDKPWEEYVKGSAIPYSPPTPDSAQTPDPSPSA